jgi:hypothetical protein
VIGQLPREKEDLPEDLEDLVDLLVTGEQWLAGVHLGKDSADGPHIDTSRILAAPKQDFRAAIHECEGHRIHAAYLYNRSYEQ